LINESHKVNGGGLSKIAVKKNEMIINHYHLSNHLKKKHDFILLKNQMHLAPSFSNISTMDQEPNLPLHGLGPPTYFQLEDFVISDQDLLRQLLILNTCTNKPLGPDGISPLILNKHCLFHIQTTHKVI
jgi:hypothetical protein